MNSQILKKTNYRWIRLHYIFATLLLLANIEMNSQSLYSLRGGWNYCRVTGIKARTYTPQTGYHLGAGYEWIFSNPVGLKTELIFNKKGFYSLTEIKTAMTHQKHINEVNQISLLLPVLSALHFKRFSVEIGPYFDFLLKTDQYEKIERINFPEEIPRAIEYFNRHKFVNPELGFIFGANAPVIKGFNFSARYLQGFSPIGKEHYNWRRMSVVQLAVSKSFGQQFTPKRVVRVPDRYNQALAGQYNIITSTHISRVSFSRTGDGNQVVIRLRSAETGSLTISNISLEASEGFVASSGSQLRINDVRFPVEGRLRYTVTNILSGNEHESYFEFEIIESGLWEIFIFNN